MGIDMKEAEKREETSGLSLSVAKKIYKRWKAFKKSEQLMSKMIDTMRKEMQEQELKLKSAEDEMKKLKARNENL